jgi:hypothetical protein
MSNKKEDEASSVRASVEDDRESIEPTEIEMRSPRPGSMIDARPSTRGSEGLSEVWDSLQNDLESLSASASLSTSALGGQGSISRPASAKFAEPANPTAMPNPMLPGRGVSMPRLSEAPTTSATEENDAGDEEEEATREVPTGWVVGSSQTTLETMVESGGTGYYLLCVCLLLRREVALWHQLLWWLGANILLFLQICSLLGLLVQVMMPACRTSDDCSYPGYFCASLAEVATIGSHHLCPGHGDGLHRVYPAGGPYRESRPFCMECRLAVCADNVFNGTKVFALKTLEQTNAADYCLTDVDPTGSTLATCYPMAIVRKEATATSYLVMALVAIGVAVAIMDEKRQLLVQFRILTLCIDLPSTAEPTAATLEIVLSRFFRKFLGGDEGAIQTAEDGSKRRSGGEVDAAAWMTFHEWMAIEVPGDPKQVAFVNAVRHFMIFSLAVATYVRRFILLALVPLTVSALIMFEGSDPLNVLLNGLATVFLLELDDAIGAAAFTAHYRARVSGHIYDVISKVEHLNLHSKVDNACCYIDGWVCAFIIFNNVAGWSAEYDNNTCISILLQQAVTACVVNTVAQGLQQIIRREIFFWRVHLDKKYYPKSFRRWLAVASERVPIICRKLLLDVFSFTWLSSLMLLFAYALAEARDSDLAWDLFFFDFTTCSAWQSDGGKCARFKMLKSALNLDRP